MCLMNVLKMKVWALLLFGSNINDCKFHKSSVKLSSESFFQLNTADEEGSYYMKNLGRTVETDWSYKDPIDASSTLSNKPKPP